jgi:hypothetical protein
MSDTGKPLQTNLIFAGPTEWSPLVAMYNIRVVRCDKVKRPSLLCPGKIQNNGHRILETSFYSN